MTDVADRGVVAALISSATGGHQGEIADAITGHGFSRCAKVLLEEIAGRIRPPAEDVDEVRIRLDVVLAAERHSEWLVFDAKGVRRSAGFNGPEDATITWHAVDLVTQLFGNGNPAETASWEFEPTWVAGLETKVAAVRAGELDPAELATAFDARVRAVSLAAHAVRGAVSAGIESLEDLAIRFDSDKWGHHHWYARHYERHFRALRDHPVRVLEIGIGGYRDPDSGGASLRMWERYFRRGLVFGLDIHDKAGLDSARITTISGDQSDAEFLDRIGREHGPFDIVIDDGSHLNEHVLISFEALFPYVRDEGLYVVEDLQTSYWQAYGGDRENFTSTGTGVGYFKSLVDGLNYQEWKMGNDYVPSYTERNITSLTFYHNMVFVTKGVNGENGWPHWARMPLRSDA